MYLELDWPKVFYAEVGSDGKPICREREHDLDKVLVYNGRTCTAVYDADMAGQVSTELENGDHVVREGHGGAVFGCVGAAVVLDELQRGVP